jgi:salicylate hydroxylase
LERRNPVGAINIDVPLSLMQDDPDLAVLAAENQNFWMGPGGAFAGGAVRDLGVYNGVFTTEAKLGTQGEWFVKGDLGRIAEKYKDWDPRLLKFLKLANPDDCYVWNITDLPPLPRWSKERTVLIGDAVHATLPFMGLVRDFFSLTRLKLIHPCRAQPCVSKTEPVLLNASVARRPSTVFLGS